LLGGIEPIMQPIRAYRNLTFGRLTSHDGIYTQALERLKAETLEEWRVISEVEEEFQGSLVDGLALLQARGYDLDIETDPLPPEKLVLYAIQARGLTNHGVPADLDKALRICKRLNLSLPAASESDDDLFLWWLVNHTHAYTAMSLNLSGDAISLFGALATLLDRAPRPLGWRTFALALTRSNKGIVHYGSGELGHAAVEFSSAVELENQNPPALRSGMPANNLADLYRFVVARYRNLLRPSTVAELKSHVDSLSAAALGNDPEDAIYLYNKGFRKFEDGKFEEAARLFRKSQKGFKDDSKCPENLAGTMAAFCMNDIARGRKSGASARWRQILSRENHPTPAKRKEEGAVTRDFLVEALNQHDMFINGVLTELNLHKQILTAKSHPENEGKLAVLRRWNSFTPCLPTGEERAEGGGYFITWNGQGLVIDPGFDFVQHFLAERFSLADITGILVTHAHLDHCSELDSVLTLLFERLDELRRDNPGIDPDRVDLFLSVGAAMKTVPWVGALAERSEIVGSIRILSPGDSASLGDIEITTRRARHSDILSDKHCLSVKVNLKSAPTDAAIKSLAFTSDTAWDSDLEAFCDADVVVAHIGTISVREAWLGGVLQFTNAPYEQIVEKSPDNFIEFNADTARGLGIKEEDYEAHFRKYFYKRKFPDGEDAARLPKAHLGLTGVIRLARRFRDKGKIFVISEFGQELGIFRASLAPVLKAHFEKQGSDFPTFRTGDSGLVLDLQDGTTRCYYCGTYHKSVETREIVSLARDRQIRYVCPQCYHVNRERILKDLQLSELEDSLLA